MFDDRQDAGRQLAEKLKQYCGTAAVVLALPRGGVVVGREIARALKLPLDVAIVRKIGHPFWPEYAIGAVDDTGAVILNESEAGAVNQAWLSDEIQGQKEEAMRRVKSYRKDGKPAAVSGKTAIIADDGVATGLTMRLAVQAVRARKPARVVVAVPVASAEAVKRLEGEGAEVVVLESPEKFLGAVGSHYANFIQTEDAEVIRLLSLSRQESL